MEIGQSYGKKGMSIYGYVRLDWPINRPNIDIFEWNQVYKNHLITHSLQFLSLIPYKMWI